MGDPSNTTEHVRALASLISSSVESIIGEYDSKGKTIPSLDSLERGPFDGFDGTNVNVRRSIQAIEGACAQLMALVAPPSYVMTGSIFRISESATLRVVVDAKIADLLDDKPQGLHVKDLAKLSGYSEDKLTRVLRFLSSVKHIFRETAPDVYVNNRYSVYLKSSNDFSAVVGHLGDECAKAWSYLPETMADPKLGHSNAPEESAMSKVWDKPLWEVFKENPAMMDRFNRAMVGSLSMRGKDSLAQAIPWKDYPADTVLCDVGGGVGHNALQVLKVYPHIKFVIQDLPNVIEDAKQFWDKANPEAIKNGRVSLIPIDFFKESPVKADIYYMASILHDWPDHKCTEILDNIRKVMKPGNSLVIADITLYDSESLASGKVENKAPKPLPPNWGAGSAVSYAVDLHMMTCLNGRERTLKSLIDLAAKSGFEFKSFWDGVDVGISEFTVSK